MKTEFALIWTPQGACPFLFSAPQGVALQVQEDDQSSLPMPLVASLDTVPVTCCVPCMRKIKLD